VNIILFGAGVMGQQYLREIDINDTIVAIADNNDKLQGTSLYGHAIISPVQIADFNYDKIVIAIADGNAEGFEAVQSIIRQLHDLNVSKDKIALSNVLSKSDPRVEFLRRFQAENPHVEGAIAECGVNKGYYAYYLNRIFKDRKLYLFDSFEGFSEESVKYENNAQTLEWIFESYKRYDIDARENVMMRMDTPENVQIIKGFVPYTLAAVDNECFAFVVLDMDIYQPTYDALQYFHKKMKKGGAIMLHDYYAPELFPGVKRAVDEFAKHADFVKMPIGDNYSVVLIFI